MNQHRSSELSPGYLADADALREAALRGLLPAHQCDAKDARQHTHKKQPPVLHSGCKYTPLRGPQLASILETWNRHNLCCKPRPSRLHRRITPFPCRRYGHVADELENGPANETADLAQAAAEMDQLLIQQCDSAKAAMRHKLRRFMRNKTNDANARRSVLREHLSRLRSFQQIGMSHAVGQASFWRVPSKIAVLSEQLARQHERLCTTRLQDQADDHERTLERWWIESKRQWLKLQEEKKKQPPPPQLTAAEKAEQKARHRKKEVEKQERRQRERAKASKKKGGGDALPPNRGGREECFTVYD